MQKSDSHTNVYIKIKYLQIDLKNTWVIEKVHVGLKTVVLLLLLMKKNLNI